MEHVYNYVMSQIVRSVVIQIYAKFVINLINISYIMEVVKNVNYRDVKTVKIFIHVSNVTKLTITFYRMEPVFYVICKIVLIVLL